MSKKRTDRELRLKLFSRGNTQCPVCLTPFTKMQVEFGKKVTLEHAPPEALGGKVVCLTCEDCNHGASRLDHAAKMAQKARDDHVSGRGTQIEIDFFGARTTSGYVRPKNDEMAARLAKQPVPRSIGQLRGAMKLRGLPRGAELDANKGIRFKIKQPKSHHVAVSWLRSAYLLVFSLLGRQGYRYVQSPALQPIREQIMNPDEERIKGALGGVVSGVDFPVDPVVDPVILLSAGHELSCWAVKMGDKSVLLPCGGSIERFRQLTRQTIDVSNDRLGFWASRQFRNDFVFNSAINREADGADIDFMGGRLEIQMESGDVWEWIIVDYQADKVVALPFRAKGAEQDGSMGVIMILDRNQYLGRKDRSKFTAALPKKLLSFTVDR